MPVEPTVDLARGRLIQEQWKARLEAMPLPPILPGVDRRGAALAVLRGLQAIDARGLLPALERLPAEDWSINHLATAGDGAHALLVIHSDLGPAREALSSARVDPAVVAEATTLRKRMLRVLVAYFEDDEEVGPEIAYIQSGRGLLDLSDDMARTAKLHTTQHDILKESPRLYDPADAVRAMELANLITGAFISEIPSSTRDLQVQSLKVCSIMSDSWVEVADAVNFVTRKAKLKEFKGSLRTLARMV